MQTLFIDNKNAQIELDRGRLVVRMGDTRPMFSVPTRHLEILVISAPIKFSSSLLTGLTQENIVTIFLNPLKTDACTMTTGMMHNDATRRLLQYRAINNTEIRIHFAKQLMQHKLRLQKVALSRALHKRPDQRHSLFTGINRVDAQLNNIQKAQSMDSLRGMEGAASAAYFEAYQSLFAASLEFTNRNRRPPRDPVNVILSLTYTLLHAEAIRALFATGFDPLLGIYHEPSFGRESLASDLVELYRPLAERWIWRLFADGTLRHDHFSNDPKGERPCLLGKAGREIYYYQFHQQSKVWKRLMRKSTRLWLNELRKHYPE